MKHQYSKVLRNYDVVILNYWKIEILRRVGRWSDLGGKGRGKKTRAGEEEIGIKLVRKLNLKELFNVVGHSKADFSIEIL